MAELVGGVRYRGNGNISDCNDAITGYYVFAAKPNNSPSKYGGILFCLKVDPIMTMQLYMSDADGLFSRYRWYSNQWADWVKL